MTMTHESVFFCVPAPRRFLFVCPAKLSLLWTSTLDFYFDQEEEAGGGVEVNNFCGFDAIFQF